MKDSKGDNEDHPQIALVFPNLRVVERIVGTPHIPSLSLGYLAGMLHKHNIPYKIIDAYAQKLNNPKLYETLKALNPKYVGFTTNITLAPAAISHIRYLRKRLPELKIILGGPWATVEYEFLFKHNLADIVVLGEGEYTLLELMQTDCDPSALPNIKGIAYKENDEIKVTEPRPNIMDLDSLPFPRWEDFPILKCDNIPHTGKLTLPFLTSRGCPYHCLNCTKVIHGYKLRLRSDENILEELDKLKAMGCKEIMIEDDMFNFDLKRIKRLLRKIIARNYNFKFQLTNGIGADRVDEEFARLMRLAGVYHVALGIESGSQKVVNFLRKGLNLKVVPRAVRILQKEGMCVGGYFIMGLPPENINSLIYTVHFGSKLKLHYFSFFNVVLFPGTGLYEYVKKHNKEFTFEGSDIFAYDYHYAPLPFRSKRLSTKDLKKVRAYYTIRFLFNPRSSLRLLRCLPPRQFLYFFKKYIKIFIRKIMYHW